jgi:Mg-chelatase subunit ChlD/lysophospholipase L1-like esterase
VTGSRPRRAAAVVAVAALALLGLAPGAVAGDLTTAANAAAPADTADPDATYSGSTAGGQPLVVVVDLSSSMLEDDGTGTVRLDGAKTALIDVVRAQPPNQKIALWTYPGAGGSCSSGGWVSGADPGDPADPSALSATVRALQANGDTPTGPALRAVADDLSARGMTGATVLLVSDGEANCNVDACTAAQDIVDQGFDLSVLAMGFQISDAGREQLQCIAQATEGAYYDVQDSADLSKVLDEVAVPQLTLDVDATNTVPARSAMTVHATVSNPSANDAMNVQVALAFTDAGAQSLFPAVLPPRMRLGTVPAGQSVSRSWTVSTGGEGFGTAAWRVTAWAQGTGVVAVTGSTTVTQETLGLSDAGPILQDALGNGPLVILGDSYSSGEGAGDYIEPKDGKQFDCHRSYSTYGVRLVGEDRTTIVACSGAVSGDFFSPNDGRDVPAQLKALADLDEAPGAVALTIGGNDINFSGIVKSCVMPGNCAKDADLRKKVFGDIAELGTSLQETYRAVDGVVNSAQRVEQRGGKRAPIVVLPYIQVLAEWQRASCPGFDTDEVRFGNDIVTALDEAVRTSVAAVAADGLPVYSADPVHEAVLPNHTACADEPYVNDAGLTSIAGRAVASGKWVVETLHPNASGYSAITNALVTWSQTSGLTLPNPTTPAPAVATGSVISSSSAPRTTIRLSGTGTTTIRLEAGSAVDVTVTGVAPDAPVTIVVHSARLAIGSLVADDEGTAHGVVYVPAGLAPGAHTLSASGFDADGKVLEYTQPLTVLPATPWWFRPLAGLAGAALLAGLVLLMVRRRTVVPKLDPQSPPEQGRETR